MAKIKCPNCGEIIEVDPSQVEDLTRQLRDELFAHDLEQRLAEVGHLHEAQLETARTEERREADEFRRRHQERSDRLLERRRNLLKRSGANIEDMTRKALLERPEDPRTVQLRKELDELKRSSERRAAADAENIRILTENLKASRTEVSRLSSASQEP